MSPKRQQEITIPRDPGSPYVLTWPSWLNGLNFFGIIYIFSRENKVQSFFSRVHWLSELSEDEQGVSNHLRKAKYLGSIAILRG